MGGRAGKRPRQEGVTEGKAGGNEGEAAGSRAGGQVDSRAPRGWGAVTEPWKPEEPLAFVPHGTDASAHSCCSKWST